MKARLSTLAALLVAGVEQPVAGADAHDVADGHQPLAKVGRLA